MRQEKVQERRGGEGRCWEGKKEKQREGRGERKKQCHMGTKGHTLALKCGTQRASAVSSF